MRSSDMLEFLLFKKLFLFVKEFWMDGAWCAYKLKLQDFAAATLARSDLSGSHAEPTGSELSTRTLYLWRSKFRSSSSPSLLRSFASQFRRLQVGYAWIRMDTHETRISQVNQEIFKKFSKLELIQFKLSGSQHDLASTSNYLAQDD